MLTTFVKPGQVLSYLVLAIAPFFVSETRSKRSRNYSVSESQGVPRIFPQKCSISYNEAL